MGILAEADKIVSTRNSEYGDPVKSWNEIAQIVSILTGKDFTAIDCVIMQKVVKLVREKYQWKKDNRVDEAGYLKIEDRLKEKRTQ